MMPPRVRGGLKTTRQQRNCADCEHAKVKGGILAYCGMGYWQKQDGKPKHIRVEYLPKSKLAQMATDCEDFEEA